MSKTIMKAGRVSAVYIHDGQGRRLVLADQDRTGLALERVLVVATHQGEARELIATLKQLAEELPPAPNGANGITWAVNCEVGPTHPPAPASSAADILTLAEHP